MESNTGESLPVPVERLSHVPEEEWEMSSAIDYRVALRMAGNGYGATTIARILGRKRGLVQSWIVRGRHHRLAGMSVALERVSLRYHRAMKALTLKNIEYLVARKLFELPLSSATVSRYLSVPSNTVNSWRRSRVPRTVKTGFEDDRMVEARYAALLEQLKSESTGRTLAYHLAVRMAQEGGRLPTRNKLGGRRIGAALGEYMHRDGPIPEGTVVAWITGQRRPSAAVPELTDRNLIDREYHRMADFLTQRYMRYHLACEMALRFGMKYTEAAGILGEDRERVRGWLTKGRGSPLARLYRDVRIIERELARMASAGLIPSHSPPSPEDQSRPLSERTPHPGPMESSGA